MAAIVIAAIVVVAILATTNVVRSSGSGSLPLHSLPSGVEGDDDAQAVGWEPFNTTSSGEVAVAWAINTSGALGGAVVVAGTCEGAGCDGPLQDAVECQGPPVSSGAPSDVCSFSGPSGPYTLIALVVAGYESSTVVNFSYTVSTPILPL